MRFEKEVLATDMVKPYAIGMLMGDDAKSFVVATEKDGPCRRFALDGTQMEDINEGPGGVMTVMQTPGRTDQLMATYKFFSPNFGGDDAKIATYTRQKDGFWKCQILCDLPYVHRFGVLKGTDGQEWLIACTIKSACRQYKNDWKTPGAVYVAKLPSDNLEQFDKDHQLKLTCLATYQLQNHGYYTAPDRSYALVGTAAGAFRYTPPAKEGDEWQVDCLIVDPTSDMALGDFDGDGKEEIVTISRFHGDTLSVWHQTENEDCYEKVWEDPEKRPFLHAIWSGELYGKSCAVLGNRKGGRDLLKLTYENGNYEVQIIDHDCGPANCWVYNTDGCDYIISANRESNEVALYEVIDE